LLRQTHLEDADISMVVAVQTEVASSNLEIIYSLKRCLWTTWKSPCPRLSCH